MHDEPAIRICFCTIRRRQEAKSEACWLALLAGCWLLAAGCSACCHQPPVCLSAAATESNDD